MDIPTEVITAIIAATPGLVGIIVSWILQHQESARSVKQIDTLYKRVQVIERLLTLEKHLTDERRDILITELAEIAEDLVTERVKERTAGAKTLELMPRLRRWLLLYDQPTWKASLYRAFYWIFTFFIGGMGSFVTFSMPIADWDRPFLVFFPILFYVAIGIIFRSAAVRQQKQAQETAGRAAKSESIN